MKRCAYCTTENRDEAIFCSHCRRPLEMAQESKVRSSSNLLIGILVAVLLLGLSSFLFWSRSPLSNASNETPSTRPAATRTREPVTLSTCVSDTTRIRRSPSTRSETIGGLPLGTCLTILGRNEDASWAYIVSDDHQTGWVAASVLPDAGDISKVSVRDVSEMANPARPTLTSEEIAHGAEVYLTQVAATNMPQSPLSQYVVPCFESADRIGDHISCRVGKAYCDYLPALEGSPTFCNDRPYPDQTFALVVFGEDWSDYDGQCLIVSGYLQIDRGVLQIQALNRDQVSSCK